MNIPISSIVYDIVVKSFFLNVENFNAHFKYSFCIDWGNYLKNWVVLIGTNAPLKTNETFYNKSNEI